jgi:hypothetical protein
MDRSRLSVWQWMIVIGVTATLSRSLPVKCDGTRQDSEVRTISASCQSKGTKCQIRSPGSGVSG